MTLSLSPIGRGTANDPERCAAVVDVLERGSRHVDTARTYGNDGDVEDGTERADRRSRSRPIDPEDVPR